MTSPHRAELRIVVGMLEQLLDKLPAGNATVEVPTGLAHAIVFLVKPPPKPRGRPPLSPRDQFSGELIISQARSGLAKMIAAGVPKGEAEELVIQEVVKAFASRRRPLADSTIKRRLEGRR